MEIVLLLAGILCVAVGVYVFYSALATSRTGERFDGEVIGYAASPGGRNGAMTYAPVFEFQHPRDGRCVAQHPISGGGIPYVIGERVRVLVSHEEPLGARIDTNGAFWFGGVFATAGVVLIFFMIFRWTPGSIAFSLLVGAVIVWQVLRRKGTVPAPGKFAKSMRSAAMSEAGPEAAFDRATLVPRSEIDARLRSQPRQAFVSGLIILGLGAAGLVWSYFWVAKRTAFLASAVSAEGTVVSLERSSGTKSTTWAPVVEFTPRDTSNAVRFRHPVSSSNPSWSVGDRVPVLYDPGKPETAMIDSGRWNRITPYFPGAAGALMIFGGAAALRSGRRLTARLQEFPGAGLA